MNAAIQKDPAVPKDAHKGYPCLGLSGGCKQAANIDRENSNQREMEKSQETYQSPLPSRVLIKGRTRPTCQRRLLLGRRTQSLRGTNLLREQERNRAYAMGGVTKRVL